METTSVPFIENYNKCSCVSFAKWIAGVSQDVTWGNAWEIAPNVENAPLWGFVLLDEGMGHIAYYERSGDILKLKESNYIPCQYSEREIPLDYPSIRGYYLP